MDSELFELLRGYSALVHPRKLSAFPPHSDCQFTKTHTFLLNAILLNPHLNTYPPSPQYQRSFWKWAISHLETALSSSSSSTAEDPDAEIDPRIYTHYTSLLSDLSSSSLSPALHSDPAVTASPPSQSFVTHFLRVPDHSADSETRYQTVTLLEARTMIEGGTTGLRTWLASAVLSQYLTLHPDLVAHQRVLELGCGTGFLGATVAALQQQAPKNGGSKPALWLSDVNEEVLTRCSDNLRLPCNASSTYDDLHYTLLNWSSALDPFARPHTQALLDEIDPAVILGADLVFDPVVLPALVGVLCLALRPGGRTRGARRVAIVALTVRNEETLAGFVRTAEQALMLEEIPFAVDDGMCLGLEDSVFGVRQEVKIFNIGLKEEMGDV